MNAKRISVSLIAAVVTLTGCAQMPRQDGSTDKTSNTAAGAAIGCVAGALIARATGRSAASGCAAGALVGGLIGFEQARQAEIAAAETTRQETLAALAKLPPAQAKTVKVSEVKTVEVLAKDKSTNETKKYAAFDSVTVDMPLSAKGTPGYEEALGKLKTLAQRVADERGSSTIIIGLNAGDTKAQKVALEANTVKTEKGGEITVSRVVDPTLTTGTQRMTVKAGAIKTTEV